MEPELKEALARITSAMQDATQAAERAAAAADRSTQAVRDLRTDFGYLTERVSRLESTVHGSKPPPPGAPSVAAVASAADAHASAASLDVAALEGRVIAGFAEVRAELGKQSAKMGIGVSGLRWLVMTSDGRQASLRFATLIGAAYAAFRLAAWTPTALPPPSPGPAISIPSEAR